MTDVAFSDTPSTVLDADPGAHESGGGAPRVLPADEPASLRDTIASVVKEDAKPDETPADTEDTKDKGTPEEKPKAEEKPKVEDGEKLAKDRAPDGKFAAKDKPDADDAKPEDAKPAEAKGDGRHITPPSRFMPDAKEHWRNTPRSVQRDIEVMTREHEADVQRFREVSERYETIRDFDELARSNGRDLRESLMRVNQIENQLQANPIAGLNAILLEAGPRGADGRPLSLFDVAQYIVSQGQQGYAQLVQQVPQQQQPQQNDEVAQLRQQLQEMQVQQVLASIIEPFRQSHPRYDELQQDIALFLKSGKIPAGLSDPERLAVAYDMAERINPPSHAAPQTDERPAQDPGRADDSFSGSKSIKSAPGAVTPDLEPERGGSIRDLLLDETRRRGRS